MPERYCHHRQWTPGRLNNWAADVDPDTLQWVNGSCRRASSEGLSRLKQIKSILKTHRDLILRDSDLHPWPAPRPLKQGA
jgi:hypothetical protein